MVRGLQVRRGPAKFADYVLQYRPNLSIAVVEAKDNTHNLHTVVRLPNGVFNPYTGIKTNLLFFTRGQPTTDVWFYEHPYPPGYKSYSKTKPIRIDEFETEKQWWGVRKGKKVRPGEPDVAKREENEFAWKVSAEDIAANGYNLDIKNPHSTDDGPGDPDELLQEFVRVDAEAASVLEALKQELAAALSGESR